MKLCSVGFSPPGNHLKPVSWTPGEPGEQPKSYPRISCKRAHETHPRDPESTRVTPHIQAGGKLQGMICPMFAYRAQNIEPYRPANAALCITAGCATPRVIDTTNHAAHQQHASFPFLTGTEPHKRIHRANRMAQEHPVCHILDATIDHQVRTCASQRERCGETAPRPKDPFYEQAILGNKEHQRPRLVQGRETQCLSPR